MSKVAVVFSDIQYREDGTLWWKTTGKGRNLNKPIGSLNKGGYLQGTVAGKQKKVHHMVWFIHKGVWPKQLDHINKIKTDNRVHNLRESVSLNNHNRDMPLPSSGLIGASWNKAKQKFKSSIKINGTNKHLGYFTSAKYASLAYLKAKKEILNGR
tara:strand:+ start:21 stop:485 length:465 start_codon:yes stop_codon:yes gene_type:complete